MGTTHVFGNAVLRAFSSFLISPLSLLLNSKINCDLQKNQLLMIKSSIFELKMTYIRLKNNLFCVF
ncbi:hypothetical protein CBG25_18545 [Arsenophonus sp. ENCA]|nr:hypothetical protein CBG25_18545 [Arsenophonus sp. ENCA]